jgi:hypothetical protein
MEGVTRSREDSGPRRRNLHPIAELKLMTVRTRPHRLTTRPRLGRRATRAAGTTDALRQQEAQPQPLQARERAAGGPEDTAAYRCSCGCVFDAPVSTTVGCPHCGDTQAW